MTTTAFEVFDRPNNKLIISEDHQLDVNYFRKFIDLQNQSIVSRDGTEVGFTTIGENLATKLTELTFNNISSLNMSSTQAVEDNESCGPAQENEFLMYTILKAIADSFPIEKKGGLLLSMKDLFEFADQRATNQDEENLFTLTNLLMSDLSESEEIAMFSADQDDNLLKYVLKEKNRITIATNFILHFYKGNEDVILSGDLISNILTIFHTYILIRGMEEGKRQNISLPDKTNATKDDQYASV